MVWRDASSRGMRHGTASIKVDWALWGMLAVMAAYQLTRMATEQSARRDADSAASPS